MDGTALDGEGARMEIVTSLVLGAGILVGIEQLWRSCLPDGGSAPPATLPDGLDDVTVESGLFSRAFVQARMHALTAELERLDQDPEVFARAFHTLAAREAYQALAVEASRLADQVAAPGPVLEAVTVGTSGGRREILDL